MPYLIDNEVVYIHDKFIYRVNLFRSYSDETISITELISSKDFELDKFIGYREITNTKKDGVYYSKEIEIIAAPEEFIKENYGTYYEDKPKKRKRTKSS